MVPAEQLLLFQQLWSDFRLSTSSWCPVATNVGQLQSIEDEIETVHSLTRAFGLHALADATVDSYLARSSLQPVMAQLLLVPPVPVEPPVG
jgi:hypothetical protein